MKYAALQGESLVLPFLLELATKKITLCICMFVHMHPFHIYIEVYIYVQIPDNTLLFRYCKQIDNPNHKLVNNMGKHQS